jgi:hypothetical protein
MCLELCAKCEVIISPYNDHSSSDTLDLLNVSKCIMLLSNICTFCILILWHITPQGSQILLLSEQKSDEDINLLRTRSRCLISKAKFTNWTTRTNCINTEMSMVVIYTFHATPLFNRQKSNKKNIVYKISNETTCI